MGKRLPPAWLAEAKTWTHGRCSQASLIGQRAFLPLVPHGEADSENIKSDREAAVVRWKPLGTGKPALTILARDWPFAPTTSDVAFVASRGSVCVATLFI